jgi:hypothetical protein
MKSSARARRFRCGFRLAPSDLTTSKATMTTDPVSAARSFAVEARDTAAQTAANVEARRVKLTAAASTFATATAINVLQARDARDLVAAELRDAEGAAAEATATADLAELELKRAEAAALRAGLSHGRVWDALRTIAIDRKASEDRHAAEVVSLDAAALRAVEGYAGPFGELVSLASALGEEVGAPLIPANAPKLAGMLLEHETAVRLGEPTDPVFVLHHNVARAAAITAREAVGGLAGGTVGG